MVKKAKNAVNKKSSSKEVTKKKTTVKKVAKKVTKKPVKKAVITKPVKKKVRAPKPVIKKIVKKAPVKKVTKKVATKKTVTKPTPKKTAKKSAAKKPVKSKVTKKKVIKGKVSKKKATKKKKLDDIPHFDSADDTAFRSEFDFSNVPSFDEVKSKMQGTDVPDLDALFKKNKNLFDTPANANKEGPLINPDEDELPAMPVSEAPAYEEAEAGSAIDTMPEFPQQPVEEPKEKKSFWSRLFGKKEKESKELIEMPPSIQNGFKEDESDLESTADMPKERKEEIYLDNMYRRMDGEIRERHTHLDSKEKAIESKEKDVIKKEEKILKKEFEVAKKEKEYDEINKLKDKLENQQISLDYQKQKVEELKAELAEKDADLKAKEAELEKREAKIAELEEIDANEENEIRGLHTQINEEDDAIDYLEKELERQKKEFEEKMMSLNVESDVATDSVSEVHALINKCYSKLSGDNFDEVSQLYAQVRDKYVNEAKNSDSDGELYKEVMKLYEDINKTFNK